jgi:hypothetical protein
MLNIGFRCRFLFGKENIGYQYRPKWRRYIPSIYSFDLSQCNLVNGETDSFFPYMLINWLLEMYA